MIDDLAWRKFPRDIIRNENLDYIASLMQPGTEALPLLLYTVAYCKADDNGCFDLGNGVIFSRLVKLGTVEDLFYCADLMEQQNLIQKADADCNVYIITDWENPNRSGRNASVPLTADQRRAVVAQKIAAEKNAKIRNLNDNFSKNVAKTPFFAPKTTNFENLSLKQREREERETDRQTEEREEKETEEKKIENLENLKRDTHTESNTSGNFKKPTVLQDRSVQNNQTYNAEPIRQEQESYSDIEQLAKEAIADSENSNVYQNNENAAFNEICDTLTIFFAKNDISFKSRVQNPEVIQAIHTIADRILTLSSDKNPPNIVATVFIGAFKKLSTSDGYYHNIELTPENMIKRGPWGKILHASSASLLTRTVPNQTIWEKQLLEYQKEYEEHHAKIDNLMNQELEEYGINPNDPDRLGKLIRAQAGEHGNRDTG